MKNKLHYITTIFLLLTTTISYAQDTSILSLSSVFSRIEGAYPEVLMYASKINAIQAQADGAKSWMPPIISFGLDRFPYQLSEIKMKDDPMNQAGLMISIEQMIPNSNRLKAKQNYLNSLTYAEENKAAWTLNTLRSNAKLLYYNRYIAERKIEIVNQNIQLLNLFIETAEERYVYNQSDLSTIYKARAKIADLNNMLSMLNSQISESNIGLNVLMNRAVGTPFLIDTNITIINIKTQQAFDTSINNRNDILSIDNTIASMKLNQDYMSSFKNPDFGLKIQHMQMFGMPNQFSLMGMVTIPIVPWSSKMYTSEVSSMEFEISAMQLEKETMQLMAYKMISETGTMFNYEKEQLHNYENEIIPAYQKNLQTTILAFKQNTESFFILLDAWEMSLMKEIEYLNKLNSVLQLQVEYEFETGKI